MSIRTEENLNDSLARDLIWRKREITVLRWLLSRATPDRRGPLLRSTVALIYAHWEGYIKGASCSYLEFLHFRRLPYFELAPNFIALSVRSMLRRSGASNKLADHLELTNFFLRQLREQSRLPYQDGISTRANLSSAVLKEIIETLGLDYSPFESKGQLIDERLLRVRNTIAHGEYLSLDESSVYELIDEVVGMLENFRTQIDNAVALQAYRLRDQKSLR